MKKMTLLQILNFVAVICFIVLFLLMILKHILPVLLPFILSGILVYLLYPAVIFLQYKLKLPRLLAILVSLLFVLIFILLFFTAFIPPIIQEALSLINNNASIIERLKQVFYQDKLIVFGFELPFKTEYFLSTVVDNLQHILSLSSQYIVKLTFNTISFITLIIYVSIITFYFLYDWDFLFTEVNKLFPAAWKPYLSGLAKEINSKLKNFLKGQVILCFSIFILTWIGCTLIGLNNTLLLSFLAGILEAIPIIGPIVATVPAILVALTQSPTPFEMENWHYALLVIGLYIIIQRIENMLLVPFILSKSVNIHPIIIFFALSLGGYVFGILGMLLAVPIVAILSIILGYLIKSQNSKKV